jgi:hypothetical protein
MSVNELTQLGEVFELLLRAGASPFAMVRWTTYPRTGKRGPAVEKHHSNSAKKQIKVAFIDRTAERPGTYIRSLDVGAPNPPTDEDLKQIADLGRRLLSLLQAKSVPRILPHALGRVKRRIKGGMRKLIAKGS